MIRFLKLYHFYSAPKFLELTTSAYICTVLLVKIRNALVMIFLFSLSSLFVNLLCCNFLRLFKRFRDSLYFLQSFENSFIFGSQCPRRRRRFTNILAAVLVLNQQLFRQRPGAIVRFMSVRIVSSNDKFQMETRKPLAIREIM